MSVPQRKSDWYTISSRPMCEVSISSSKASSILVELKKYSLYFQASSLVGIKISRAEYRSDDTRIGTVKRLISRHMQIRHLCKMDNGLQSLFFQTIKSTSGPHTQHT